MFAGATVMFVSCDSSTSSNERVLESDTVNAETEYEVERTTVETDTTTETVTTDENQQ